LLLIGQLWRELFVTFFLFFQQRKRVALLNISSEMLIYNSISLFEMKFTFFASLFF